MARPFRQQIDEGILDRAAALYARHGFEQRLDGAPERLVRVMGALTALAVLSIAAQHENQTTAWRPLVLATCLDTLGHRRPGALPDPHQAEA